MKDFNEMNEVEFNYNVYGSSYSKLNRDERIRVLDSKIKKYDRISNLSLIGSLLLFTCSLTVAQSNPYLSLSSLGIACVLTPIGNSALEKSRFLNGKKLELKKY